MKKLLSVLITSSLLVSSVTDVFATDSQPNAENEDYIALLSKMIQTYDSDEYFSTMSVTIGEPNLVIDGEIIPIDESGSVAYVENGRTMMPVRGIAEAIGADVSFDNRTQTVTVENEETVIAMTIGENEMDVNGQSVMLLSAPEIKEDRTMLPVRDVAEALDCEVEWQQETQTATFTRPYQTKRIIVNSENADTTNAVEAFSANGKTVIQFKSIDDAKACVAVNQAMGYIAEPDYVRTVSAMTWGADVIGADSYYSQTDYAAGSAIVAVIDTGIDYNHEFFRNKLVNGYDLYHNDNYCEDVKGHGTLVASNVLDVTSKNPNIKVMPIKVFGDSGSASSATVAEAIVYAANHGANVINLSLGGEHRSLVEQAAINYANSKNVVVVAAAGNEKLDLAVTDYSPGGLNGVITVSALNTDYTLASFSNYGNGIVEFAAPGVGVKCARNGGGYTTVDGTSLAAPHVAGVYALVKAVHPDASNDEITAALSKNAKNIGSSMYYGAGAIKVNMLEKHLSSMHFSNVQAESITDTNAVISGEIGYSGIKPEYIGVKIGSNIVYSTSFIDNGSEEMQFSCNLNSDAKYTLTPGTTYEYCIYTNQGGYELVTSKYTFTTAEKQSEPQPAPTPEPTKSDLRIIPNAYPNGNLTEGSSFGLSGRIKSNYHITDVRSYILDTNYNVLQESSGWTTTQTYVIENSNLDIGLKFGKLSAGTYYLRYYAEDETGNSVSWTSDAFKVVAEEMNPEPEPSPVVSDLRILPDSYPSGQLTQGNKFGLSGRIKSNCHITDVRSYLLDANKNVIMEASGWTTTQTYVIENSALDKGMKFDQLSAGTYYLKYSASDESGNSISWTSDAFTVVGNQSMSQLRIVPDKYPTGTLTKGKSFSLSGRIKSDYHITDVRAYLLDSNKNVIMEASGWTTTKTYVIEGSALDKGMKFSNLTEGGYYLKYTASDESGNTISWISDMFYIK